MKRKIRKENITMTNVNIEITNYRFDVENNEPETISYRAVGTCRRSRDGIKVEYREPELTGMDGTVTTVTVLDTGVISVNRVGPINTHMVFEAGKMHACIYDTGYFPVQIGIHTSKMQNSLSDRGGCFDVEYNMEIGGRLASKNRMKVTVTPTGPLSV